jgi:hypothetical protein
MFGTGGAGVGGGRGRMTSCLPAHALVVVVAVALLLLLLMLLLHAMHACRRPLSSSIATTQGGDHFFSHDKRFDAQFIDDMDSFFRQQLGEAAAPPRASSASS